MTKWDTIQLDVSDMYLGLEENLAWEEAIANGDVLTDNFDDDELTLDWDN
jgi:hypothetical protein